MRYIDNVQMTFQMKYLLVFLWISLYWRESLGIYGGCMSYRTSPSSKPEHIKLQIYFLNGWKLHEGPCYNCTENDEGTDVTARRNNYISVTGNQNVFGTWSLELPTLSVYSEKEIDITREVYSQTRDVVLMVNSHEHWEMESSEINLEINTNTSFNNLFDVKFEDDPDERMTLVPNYTKAFLQVKVDSNVRSDTGKPNNSPIVLIKPLNSLEKGKAYHLHIPVIDNDDDHVTCDLSEYIEAGKLNGFLEKFKKDGFLSVDKACILNLNLTNTTFSPGQTFGIAITVKDFARSDVNLAEEHQAYKTLIGRVTVLMYFKLTDTTHPPLFVDPTPPNNQRYTVYVGGDFHVDVYARPSKGERYIKKFNFLRRDGRPVNQTQLEVPGRRGTVNISMSWSPVESDVGFHIVCSNAMDNEGISTVELHCFRIEVRANIFRPSQPIPGKPYFTSFPEPKDIVCPLHTYCRFPVYATSPYTGGIQEILSTSQTEENVTIEYGHDVINGTVLVTVGQVEFLALTPGPRQICLNASDDRYYTVRCLHVIIQRPDPCASLPCFGLALCSPFDDNSGFQCVCDRRHYGELCQHEINPCTQNSSPCVNSTCFPTPISAPYFFCTDCPLGKTGQKCNIDVDKCLSSNKCGKNEICQQVEGNVSCLPVTCAGCVEDTQSVCVKGTCICALGLTNDGVCKSEDGLFQKNKSIPHFVPPTPAIGSAITCDSHQTSCNFSVYILSSEQPVVSHFNKMSVPHVHSINIPPPRTFNPSDIYLSEISIEKDSSSEDNEFDICLNVARASSRSIYTDTKCFHVKEKGIPQDNNNNQVPLSTADLMSKLYPGCSFSTETPPRESVIGCKLGKPCHFYVYTKTSNSTCPSLLTHDEFSGIYKSRLNSGLCRYEIVYTNTNSVGKNTFCIMLCSKGESRCFQMNTNDIVDKCEPNPCRNEALCMTLPTGSVKCHCKEGFWGTYCEKGLCDSGSTCQNEAACFINYNHTTCRCRYGFRDTTCSTQSNSALTDTVENGGHFTQLNRMEILTCYIYGTCYIPLFMLKNPIKMPNVEVGFCDKTLEVQHLELDPSQSQGGIVHGKLAVVGHQLGVKKICLDSVATPRTARIEDELCFQINVTEGHYSAHPKMFPYFIDPTLPNSTIVQCFTEEQCHLRLWAKNKIGIKSCPILDVDKTIEDGVYVFPLRDTGREPCVFETSISSDNVTDTHLCFSLRIDASKQVHQSQFIEERCYTVHFLKKSIALDSCVGKSCYNAGFCDSSYSPSKCLCRSGFSGEDCSTEVGPPQGINTTLINQPIFGDVALPKLVICPLLEECVIPFSVNYNSSSTFRVNWNGTNVQNVTVVHSRITGSRDYSGRASLVHNVTGNDEFCLSLDAPDGMTYDAVCCNVTSKSTPKDGSPEVFQTHFVSPSPHEESVLTCTPGQPCHLTLSTDKAYNLDCPEVKSRSEFPVHIFASLSSTDHECHHDVTIQSNKNYTGSKECCFQTSISGIAGEMRCVIIHFEPHVLPTPTISVESTTEKIITTNTIDISTGTTNTADFTQTTATNESPSSITAINSTRTTIANFPSSTKTTIATNSTKTTKTKDSTKATNFNNSHSSTTTSKTSDSIQPTNFNNGPRSTETSKTTDSDQTTNFNNGPSSTKTSKTTDSTQPTNFNSGPSSTTTSKTTDSVQSINFNNGLRSTKTSKTTDSTQPTNFSSGPSSTTTSKTTDSVQSTNFNNGPSSTETSKTTDLDQTTNFNNGPSSNKTSKTTDSIQPTNFNSSPSSTTTSKTTDSNQSTNLNEDPSSTKTSSKITPATTKQTSSSSRSTPTVENQKTQSSENTCAVMKAKEKAMKGRVECFCFHPISGLKTKVITQSPRVSMERLLVAAGLGSGAMIITLGVAALFYCLTQKCLSPSNKETNQKRPFSKRKISASAESMISTRGNE